MEFDNYSRAEVLEKLFALWKPGKQTELVPLEESLNRISAEPLVSRFTLPLVRSSGGDGIAVRSADFEAALPGLPDTAHWKPGKDYVRADTGDDFDDAFDTVIMIEEVTFNETGGLSLTKGITVTPGMNVNGRGSAIEEGELILEAALPIRSPDLGALARGGLWDVPVVKKPVAAFIPTGNELIPLRREPQRGQNIDTNSIMARHMLLEMGAEPLILPIIRDDPGLLKAGLLAALKTADVVIINGGSSKGADDYNARLLAELGECICHGVLAAPGRPLCLGVVDNKPVVNLPGPIIAAYFGMDWCIRAILCRALGIPVPVRPRVKAVLTGNTGRTLPEGFEFFYRMEVTKTASGYDAWPVPFDRVPGKRTQGFHSGQCVMKGPHSPSPGDEIEVELCYPSITTAPGG
ncbi:molybdopterin molybdenumtransferase MoeA [Spirochaetia bacterium]|nr:molybdopterin molybdenumtransferase MoeA [Spirochaetia bacterium]